MPQPRRSPPLNLLFVCLGNSCRSQMAEALATHLGSGSVRCWSAGSRPLGYITPETRTVMDERGISIGEQQSKGLKDVPLNEMDVIVTMGCEVECPVPAGFRGRVVEWNIPDPFARGIGSFRQVRDLIEERIKLLLADLQPAAGPPASGG